jgi:hypothetical protein
MPRQALLILGQLPHPALILLEQLPPALGLKVMELVPTQRVTWRVMSVGVLVLMRWEFALELELELSEYLPLRTAILASSVPHCS